MFKIVSSSDCNNITQLVPYFACKKLNDQDFDVDKYFLKYSVFQYSSKDLVKEKYKEFIDNW
jgi:hypothetical protein